MGPDFSLIDGAGQLLKLGGTKAATLRSAPRAEGHLDCPWYGYDSRPTHCREAQTQLADDRGPFEHLGFWSFSAGAGSARILVAAKELYIKVPQVRSLAIWHMSTFR